MKEHKGAAMWELYDRLIDGIPEDMIVNDYCVGIGWTYVQSGDHVGTALSVRGRQRHKNKRESLLGKPLKSVAMLSKSWDMVDASLGTAAINCFYNYPDRVRKDGGFKDINIEDKTIKERTKKDAFIAFADEIKGKKVACIGHFPHIESQFSDICDLIILERNPAPSDYPDSACEYILQEQNYVFITGMTFINKTLPRLLQIARDHAKISIVGPSTPMSAILKDYGVNNLSGFCVTEPDILKERISRGEGLGIFYGGWMVSVNLQ